MIRDKLEKEIQKEGELALSDAFHPDLIVWTRNVGGVYPRETIKAAILRIEEDPARWRAVLNGLKSQTWGLVGEADTQGCGWGLWWGFEWKRPGKQQRAEQVIFERNIAKAGGLYFLCTSAEEAVDSVIQKMGFGDRRDEIWRRAFGPKSEVGRLRARREKR